MELGPSRRVISLNSTFGLGTGRHAAQVVQPFHGVVPQAGAERRVLRGDAGTWLVVAYWLPDAPDVPGGAVSPMFQWL